ncbi:class II D-tagatose-bisphosphate aldolase, non-catalytic subunit [Patescibacteria group bacterium]|nr:class II D-tagatose-bisphosphate aldolase, non-catalytic subunit [Patescibacteria group bacterium]
MPLRDDILLADLVRITHRLAEKGDRITHLGVCPMSEELIRAPVELALKYNFPVLFVASRNQVSEDEGGGYVMGLTPEGFVQKIIDVENSLGLNSDSSPDYMRFISVDHCGPWYREREKKLSEEEAIKSVKRTLIACLKAGYSGFHIDCSFKPPESVEMNEEKMIDLTVDLIEFSERKRVSLRKRAVSYEIGTEETAGESVSVEHFSLSIKGILSEIKKRKLPEPAFVVGRTGAEIKMLENVGGFDYTAASSLPKIARKFHIGFKEHNGDYLSSPILSLHPRYGITAVNVGPAFAVEQTRALLRLEEIEEREIGKGSSNLYQVMSRVVLEKAPFTKWLREKDKWSANELRDMPAELRAVTVVCGHYVYYDEKVRETINKLYSNLKRHRVFENPEAYVMEVVKKAIMRYVDALNLRGSTSKIIKIKK